jgi:hypothetical protein
VITIELWHGAALGRLIAPGLKLPFPVTTWDVKGTPPAGTIADSGLHTLSRAAYMTRADIGPRRPRPSRRAL